MRSCSKCGQEKILEDFPKSKLCKDGRERVCKICRNAGRKTPEQIANQKKLAQKHYKENRVDYLSRATDRYWSNPESFRAYGRQHAKNNSNIYKSARHRRRSKIKGDLTSQEVRLLFDNFDFCQYCGCRDKKLTLDHIVPVSKGGQTTLSNMAVACINCNLAKRAKDVEDFYGKNLARS